MATTVLEHVGLGILVGAIGTLIGAGGGFLLVPVLVFLDPHETPAVLTAISLCVVFANATSGSIAYARQGRVDARSGLWFALAGAPGAIAGAFLAQRIDRRAFDPLLGVVLVVASLFVLLSAGRTPPQEPGTGTRMLVERDGTVHHFSPRLGLGSALSTVVGTLSSLLGIGGGIIHVPLMVFVLGFPVHVATATSHFVLALITLCALLVHGATGSLAPSIGRAAPLAIGALLGAPVGARFSSRLHGKWILRALALALGAAGVRLLSWR